MTAEPAPKKGKWPKGLKLVYDAINSAADAGIDHRVGGDGPVVRAVTVQQAREIHSQRYVSSGEGDRAVAERQAWRRNLADARSRDLISGALVDGQELIWLVKAG